MHLQHFLCCIPLATGVIFVGFALGTVYFILGTTGLQMVIDDNYSENIIWFFRKMSTRGCVAVGSIIFYFLATINILLAYGAYTKNHRLVGTWLLVNFTMFMLTLYSALVGIYFLLNIVATGYSMFAVKSFYSTLTTTSESDSDDEDTSEEELF